MSVSYRTTVRGGIVLAALVAVLGTGATATALDLRVQGRSDLSVHARTAGTNLLVSGQLRDDLGQPLPGRRVRVEVSRSGGRSVERTKRVDTREAGSYRVRFQVPPGSYRIRAHFRATPHLTAARAEASTTVEREPVDLEVRGPSLVRTGAGPVAVRVRATIDGRGLPFPVEVAVNGETRRAFRLDDRGRGRRNIRSWLRRGRNRVVVRIPEGPHRDPSRAGFSVYLARDLTVDSEVESVFERFQRGAAIHGRVAAEDGPVSGASVKVVLTPDPRETRLERSENDGDRRLVRRAETGDDGAFRVFFPRSKLVDGRWHAHLRILPDAGDPWRRDVGTVRIDRTLSRLVVYGGSGLALLAALVIGGRESWRYLRRKLEELRRARARDERRRRAFEEEQTLEPVSVEEGLEADPAAPAAQDRVRGQVWDPWKGEPVDRALVELYDSAGERPQRTTETGPDGVFVFEELESGERELVVEADFFVRGRFSFEIPHGGELNPCRFELIPVPLKIRRLYQSIIEMAAGDDLWGELSPREIRDTVREVLGTRDDETETAASGRFSERVRTLVEGEEELESGRDYVEALTELVEETYFGPRRYGEPTWRLARNIAVELRETIERETSKT